MGGWERGASLLADGAEKEETATTPVQTIRPVEGVERLTRRRMMLKEKQEIRLIEIFNFSHHVPYP